MEVNHITYGQIEISEEHISDFCQKWRIKELALFGSVLREDFGVDSDVDVTVSFEDGAPWSLWDILDMRKELQQMFGRPVDIVEKEALRNPFRRQVILSTRKVIYAS